VDSERAEPEGGMPRKRLAPKGARASARSSVLKVKSTIHLTVEASQRLDIHATMMGLDRSALVEKLINEHLRRYIVSDRGGPNASAESPAA